MFNMGLLLSKVGFWTRRHSPELLVAGGIASAAGSVALAIYATTKLNSTLEPYNKKIEAIKKDLKDDNKIANNEVDVKQAKKELATTYGKAVLKAIALYAPSAICFASSVGCILGSHKIMQTRNLALTAACATLDQSYKAYRNRVKEKIGEEAEEKIYKDISKEEQEIVDPNTGKVKNKKIDTPHLKDNNAWNLIFDKDNPNWQPSALLNYNFLMGLQSYYNQKLKTFGYVWLYDIYSALGFTTESIGAEKMRAAHILGWCYDPSDPNRNSFISFGLTQPGTECPTRRVAAQIEANEPSFWLELNPDGDILSGEHGKEIFTKYAVRGIG